MRGVVLKNLLAGKGYSVSEVARRIGMSQQALSAALSSEDVKSSLVERISSAVDTPISEMYGERSSISATMQGGNGNRMMTGVGNVMGDGNSELVTALKGEIEMLKAIIEEKNADLKDANGKINKFIDLMQRMTEAKR